jgi:hypothetical protein
VIKLLAPPEILSRVLCCLRHHHWPRAYLTKRKRERKKTFCDSTANEAQTKERS